MDLLELTAGALCRNTFAKYARLHNISTTEHARPRTENE